MRRAVRVVSVALASCVLAATFASCLDATQVSLEARTNVPYRPGIVTAFVVGQPGQANLDPATETREPWGDDGNLGSLTVVPRSDNAGALAVSVVMGVLRDPRTCTLASPDGCIVARRRLAYVPHTKLTIPIYLYAQCEGVACTESTTCNYLGKCVSSTVDPEACRDRGECSPVDDPAPVVDRDAGDGRDGADAGATPKDAQVDQEAGGDAGPVIGGDGGIGTVECAVPLGACPPSYDCCVRLMGSGCVPKGMLCTLDTSYRVTCDGAEDCPGTICCAHNAVFDCLSRVLCQQAQGKEVCQGNACTVGTCVPFPPTIYHACQ